MELDGYDETTGLAFEYQGIQHYEYIQHFHRTFENYIKRLEYYEKKYKLCKDNNIHLILIPYQFNFRSEDKIERLIKDQITIAGF